MQVFIIGSPVETAKVLDKKRLNKQIIECRQILKAIGGSSSAWKNHPCVLQYKNHAQWLENYMYCLRAMQLDDMVGVEHFNKMAEKLKPSFHIEEYFIQMKKRLYTKDNEYYKQWSSLGTSQENWYYVHNRWKIYVMGKLVHQTPSVQLKEVKVKEMPDERSCYRRIWYYAN